MRNDTDVRSMMLSLGVPPFLATMSIPFMFFLPGAVDPDSASVIEIIRGLQNGLRRLGYAGVEANGVLDAQTASALNQISGSGWMERTWVQIYGDIITAMKNPDRKSHQIKADQGLGMYFQYEGPPVGPIPSIAAGTPPGPLGLDGGIWDWAWDAMTGKSSLNWKRVGNSCNFSDPQTLAVFGGLQKQINRLGISVEVDGKLGPNSINASRQIAAKIFAPLPAEWRNPTCEMIAANAVKISEQFKNAADRGVKLGRRPSAGAAGPPPGGPPPGTTGAMETLKKYAPYLLIAGGVAWFANSQRKGRR